MLFPVQISKVHEMLMTDLLEGIPLIHRKVYEVNEEVLLYLKKILLYLKKQKSTEDSRIIIHYSDSPLSYHCLLRVTDFFLSWSGTLLPSSCISPSASLIVLIISNILLFQHQSQMSQSTTSHDFAYFWTNKRLHNCLNVFIFFSMLSSKCLSQS